VLDPERITKEAPMISPAKLALILLLSPAMPAHAAEIKVIASTGVATVVTELGREFEAKTGHKVAGDFAVVAVSRRKIDAGAPFDIAILSPSAIDELIGQGKISGDTRTAFGRTGLGVVTRKDAPRPDIGTADAFKQTMLKAKSVGHSKEGLSGVHFLAALEKLGIAAEMQPKLRTYEGAGLAQAIGSGEVEMGVTGIGPALAIAGAQFVGPLPGAVQSYVVFTAGVAAAAQDAAAARSFLAFMTAPAAAAVFKAKGMERE
jgi:molybdate transport system substrate-binding protein